MDGKCIAVIEDDTVVRYEPLEDRRTLGNNWVATFQAGMAYMARQKLTGEQWSTFAYLVERLDYDNWVRVAQKDVAESLGINQANVSRALRKLVEIDVITKGPLAGRFNTYKLNPRIAHKGGRHYQSSIIQYDDLKRRAKDKKRNADTKATTRATN